MTPREIYKAHISEVHASLAWKRGALDGVLESAAGRAGVPLCPYGRDCIAADEWNAGFAYGQQLHRSVQEGVV